MSSRFIHFKIKASAEHFVLLHRSGDVFARLDRVTCQTLLMLNRMPAIETKAVVSVKDLIEAQTASKPTKRIAPLSINIYGPIAAADEVGNRLSSSSAFLQIPYSLESCYECFNPQLYRSGNEMQSLTHLVGLTDTDFKAKAISDAVETVLDSLDSLDCLSPELEQDEFGSLRCLGTSVSQPHAIKTTLRKYVPFLFSITRPNLII